MKSFIKIRNLTLIIFFYFAVTNFVFANPQISNIDDNKSSYPENVIPKYEKYEASFQITNIGMHLVDYNAFNPNITPRSENYLDLKGIQTDAIITSPSGKSIKYPCFWYEGNDGWKGWKLRFAPNEIGTWIYKISVNHFSGTATSSEIKFNCKQGANKGFIGLSAKDKKSFEFSDGTPFNPIEVLENQKEGNYIRLFYSNYAFEPYVLESLKFSRYNMSLARNIDALMEEEKNKGIYIQWFFDDWCVIQGLLIDKNSAAGKNSVNLQEAEEIYKRKLRYFIARWGVYDSLMSVEFINGFSNNLPEWKKWQNEVCNFVLGRKDSIPLDWSLVEDLNYLNRVALLLKPAEDVKPSSGSLESEVAESTTAANENEPKLISKGAVLDTSDLRSPITKAQVLLYNTNYSGVIAISETDYKGNFSLYSSKVNEATKSYPVTVLKEGYKLYTGYITIDGKDDFIYLTRINNLSATSLSGETNQEVKVLASEVTASTTLTSDVSDAALLDQGLNLNPEYISIEAEDMGHLGHTITYNAECLAWAGAFIDTNTSENYSSCEFYASKEADYNIWIRMANSMAFYFGFGVYVKANNDPELFIGMPVFGHPSQPYAWEWANYNEYGAPIKVHLMEGKNTLYIRKFDDFYPTIVDSVVLTDDDFFMPSIYPLTPDVLNITALNNGFSDHAQTNYPMAVYKGSLYLGTRIERFKPPVIYKFEADDTYAQVLNPEDLGFNFSKLSRVNDMKVIPGQGLVVIMDGGTQSYFAKSVDGINWSISPIGAGGYIREIMEYNGYCYVDSYDYRQGSFVVKGVATENLINGPWQNVSNAIPAYPGALAIFKENLFIANSNNHPNLTRLYKYDGINFDTVLQNGFGGNSDNSLCGMQGFGGYIYAAVYGWYTSKNYIYRSLDGITNWELVYTISSGTLPLGPVRNMNMVSYMGRLYVITSGNTHIYSTLDGVTWDQLTTERIGDDPYFVFSSIVPFNNCLYIATGSAQGNKVWKLNLIE